MATYTVYLAVLLAVGVGAVPFQYSRQTDTCATKCSGSTDKFRYQSGTTYTYTYHVTTETQIPNKNNDVARLVVMARADIEAGDGCEFTLRLSDVRLVHSTPHKVNPVPPPREQEFQTALEKTALRFAFDDGVIAEVCPDDSEETWALNFKKGLLSAFQNSMENFVDLNQRVPEIDVSGECEAEYNMTRTWGWNSGIKITKSKDVRACSKRDNFKSLLQSVPYNVASEIQSLPIVQSQQTCESSLNSENILYTIKCRETHAVVPFTKEAESGVRTTVAQTLQYNSKVARTSGSTMNVQRRQNLLFVYEDAKPVSDRRTVEQKLKVICEQTKFDLRPETPRLFSELVEVIEPLSFSDVKYLYSQLKSNVICPNNDKAMKFFRDALRMTGTPGPIQMMVEMIKENEVDGLMAQAWISSLAFVKDVSEETVQAVQPLLQTEYKEQAKLPVSSVLSAFCRKNSECQSQVRQVVSMLAQPIGYRCYVDESNRESILTSLRALGNIRELTDKDALDKCLSSSSAPLEVRVAAADAYRRSACPELFRKDDQLWSLLRDSNVDQELRVMSYLSIMRCPTESTLQDVAEFLKTVQEEQIGAFIYSHLNNLRETSDPHKQQVAESIRKLDLKPIELSAIKHSRNYEASFIINKINVGATLDSDVIMSPTAPVPRAAKLNITMDLFGEAVNMLEVGGRIEGLETILHKVLGYKLPMVKDSEMPALEDTRASVYARVFGNEVLFQSIKGSDQIMPRYKIPNYRALLDKLSEKQNYAYTFSEKIIDTSLILPTVAGIPMHLSLNGSANLDLHAQGKADFLKVTSKQSMEIDGEFRPSAAMEISADMTMDGLVTQVGMRMRNTMHSSTQVKARIHMVRGRVVDIEIDAPKDKMEIFQAKSEFFINYNGDERELDILGDRRDTLYKCTSEMAAKITGAELCLTADQTSVSINLNKKDKHRSYKVFAKQISNQKNTVAQFMMDTVGSEVNRLISADVTIGPDTTLDIHLVSPWKRLNVNTGALMNRDILSLSGTAIVDDKDKYAIVSEVKMSRDPKTKESTFSPFVKITVRDLTLTLVSGQINMVPGKKIEADIEVKDLDQTPFNLKGLIVNMKKEQRLKLELVRSGRTDYLFNLGTTLDWSKGDKNLDISPELIVRIPSKELIAVDGSASIKSNSLFTGKVTVNLYSIRPGSMEWRLTSRSQRTKVKNTASFKVKSSLLSSKVDITTTTADGQISGKVKGFYNIPQVHKNTFSWNSKVQDLSNKKFTKYTVKSTLTNKKFPEYNVGVDYAFDHKGIHSAADLRVKYGKFMKDDTIALAAAVTRDFDSNRESNVALKTSLKVPAKKVDMSLNTKHTIKENAFDSNTKLQLKPLFDDHIDLDLNLQNKPGKLNKYVGEANLRVGNKRYALESNFLQKSKNQYIHNINAEVHPGDVYKMATVYKMPGKDKHSLTSDIDVPGMKPIQVTGQATLIPGSHEISGAIMQDKDIYSLNALSKIAKDRMGKWELEVEYPDRKIEFSANGKRADDSYDGDLTLNWDAKKKVTRNSEIKLDGSLRQSLGPDSHVIKGELNLRTPFEHAKDLGTTIKYVNNPKQYNLNSKLSWGGKSSTLSSNLIVEKPLSLSNIQMKLNAITPMSRYRQVELNVDHKLDSNLLTSIQGKVDDQEGELTVKGENRGDWYNQDLFGSMDVKTPFRPLSRLVLTAEHKADSRNCHSQATLDHNGQRYEANAKMNYDQSGSALRHNGEVTIKYPGDDLMATWSHQHNGLSNINTNINAQSGTYGKFDVSLLGKNTENYHGRDVSGELSVKTPYRDYREINLKLDHSHGQDGISSKTELFNNRRKHIGYSIELVKTPETKTAKWMVLPHPDSDDITGEMTLNHGQYPKTISAWLQWDPSSRVDLDGSLDIPSFTDMAVSGKMTTSFRTLGSVTVTGSHKLERGEYISHGNVAYGIRKAIDLETRYRNDDNMKMIRAKLDTPFDSFRKMDTGVQFERKNSGFEGKVDLEMLPLLKKHDGFIDFHYRRNDLNGQIQLNTPEQPEYFVAIVKSKKNPDASRSSSIEIKPMQYGSYSLDSTYKIIRPYRMDIELKTPHPELDNVGLKMTFNPTPISADLDAVVVYLPRQEIEASMQAKWNEDINMNLIVKTPFENFRSNRILFRHDGPLMDFTTHAEAQIGSENVSFSSDSSKTVAKIHASGSVVGSKHIEGDMSISGPWDDLRGEMTLNHGNDKYKSVVINIVKPRSVKSSFSLNTPFTSDLSVELKSDVTDNYRGASSDSSFDIRYGEKYVNGNLKTFLHELEDISVDATLDTSFEEMKTVKFDLGHKWSGSDMQGKASFTSSVDAIKDISVSYNKTGPLKDMKILAQLISNQEPLVDAQMEINKQNNELHGKLVSGGKWLPVMTVTMDQKMDDNNFEFNIHATCPMGHILSSDVSVMIEGDKIQFSNKLIYKREPVDFSHKMTFKKEGNLKDFKIEASNVWNGQEVTAELSSKIDNKVKVTAKVNNFLNEGKQRELRFEHNGDLEKFLTSAKIIVDNTDIVSGKVDFYHYGLRRVELNAELSTPFDGYRFSKLEYRHEGQLETRSSCNLNIQYGNSQKITMDLVIDRRTSESIKLNIQTPFEDLKSFVMVIDVDQSKLNSKLSFQNQRMEYDYTLKGTHYLSKWPIDIKYRLTTPYDAFRITTLTVYGKPLDNAMELFVVHRAQLKTKFNTFFKYDNFFNMDFQFKINDGLNPDERLFHGLEFIVKNTDHRSYGKMTHIVIDEYFIIDGKYVQASSSWRGQDKYNADLEISSPYYKDKFPYKKISSSVEITDSSQEDKIKLVYSADNKVFFDADLTYDTSKGHKLGADFRKPHPSEYSIAVDQNGHSRSGELLMNWDKTDSVSNIRLEGALHDDSNPSSIDRRLTLKLIRPFRSIVLDQSIRVLENQYHSEGKLSWSDDDDSKVFYEIDISENRRRQGSAKDALVKLGLPTRTLGFTASIIDDGVTKKAETAFSWDMDKDDDKKIGVIASVSGADYTQADISVEMPADLKVTSALILNRGDMVLDGKTDISYSRDIRKTLTFISKIHKNQDYHRSFLGRSAEGFNYSMELGVSHPETRLDVTLNSHIGKNSDLLTSSVGLLYLTSRRQVINLALSTEIDRLRKQINLLGVSPSQTYGLKGRVISESPMSMEVRTSIDGQDSYLSTLDIDVEQKKLNLVIGEPDNKMVIRAFSPNSSAIQADIHLQESFRDTQEALFSIRLANPRLLSTRIDWRPNMFLEAEDYLVEMFVYSGEQLKSDLKYLVVQIENEFIDKHRDISQALLEDTKPLMKFLEDEAMDFERDITQMKGNLREMIERNDGYLGDIYREVIIVLDVFNRDYISAYHQVVEEIRTKLQDVNNYSVRQNLGEGLVTLVSDIIRKLDQITDDVIILVFQAQWELMRDSYKIFYYVSLHDVYNHPSMEPVRSRIESIRNSDYLTNLHSQLRAQLEPYKNINVEPYLEYIPEHYRPHIHELYDQTKSVADFWLDENAVRNKVHHTSDVLKNAIQNEIKEYADSVLVLVFDMSNGKIQVDVKLPVDVQSLEEFPELVKKGSEWLASYKPNIIQTMARAWNSNETSRDPEELIPGHLRTLRRKGQFRKDGIRRTMENLRKRQ